MKKIMTALALLLALLLALVATGCQSDEPVAEKHREQSVDKIVTPSPEPTEESTPEAYTDEQGIAALRATAPFFNDVSDDLITEGAQTLCDGWDQGLSFTATLSALVEGGLDASDGGALMGYAALVVCPEYTDTAAQWANGAYNL